MRKGAMASPTGVILAVLVALAVAPAAVGATCATKCRDEGLTDSALNTCLVACTSAVVSPDTTNCTRACVSDACLSGCLAGRCLANETYCGSSGTSNHTGSNEDGTNNTSNGNSDSTGNGGPDVWLITGSVLLALGAIACVVAVMYAVRIIRKASRAEEQARAEKQRHAEELFAMEWDSTDTYSTNRLQGATQTDTSNASDNTDSNTHSNTNNTIDARSRDDSSEDASHTTAARSHNHRDVAHARHAKSIASASGASDASHHSRHSNARSAPSAATVTDDGSQSTMHSPSHMRSRSGGCREDAILHQGQYPSHDRQQSQSDTLQSTQGPVPQVQYLTLKHTRDDGASGDYARPLTMATETTDKTDYAEVDHVKTQALAAALAESNSPSRHPTHSNAPSHAANIAVRNDGSAGRTYSISSSTV
ncbi:hypothetical protein PTSG_02044 [Salpingoeca rosetta]|uniref:Uncharacterized protein n=1 Tax=Salpingoeca rosetta (strain ATCC 50818 / BSB-021) TaxID=946362 RepID=F2TZQ2_SALR5|nr:uncharacterized protein PTSG_02044 [Salpingoeca rosetta]EGD79076.1 hypothetical protein PTSG_02044 [Salpingoeca rosetta]|eukprot:XP_004998032.1 hypothetical protein PTSG_02044 [Salpingoeca rosetta]